jgi:thiol-disulfide isomerase/thioredoxin
MPQSQITNIKATYNIQEKDIIKFEFDKESCYAPMIESINIGSLSPESNDPFRNYIVDITPLFIYEGKFVKAECINSVDIQSIRFLPKEEAVANFGCKGLSPIVDVKLRNGKTIQDKPVDRPIKLMQEQIPAQKPVTGSEHFTIIGKTTNFTDSTKLYLNAGSNSLKDNIDSAYVINNSFTFKGSVSEPKPCQIHTGYTGWQGQPPESFHEITFWVNNDTIYLNDDVGNLKFAKLSGSELQNDQNDLNEMRKSLLIAIDSTRKIPTSSPRYKVLAKELDKQRVADPQICSNFIETHPESIISVDILNGYKSIYGNKKTKYLFDLLDLEIQNSTDGKSVAEYLMLSKTINSEDFIDIELPDLNGQLIKLSSLNGKYVLLEFWASWCGPCRAEHPGLLKLYDQYKQKGFEIYGVCLDEKKEDWQMTITNDKINWITVSDLKGPDNSPAAMKYEVNGIPKSFLIDKNGIIIATDLRGEDLANKLKEIFNK